MVLYDVTLPGNGPGTIECPQLQCPATFPNARFSRRDIDKWEEALQVGPEAAKAHLEISGALTMQHMPGCPFRCLPPAVLALCGNEELLAQLKKVGAVLDDCQPSGDSASGPADDA
ncbi:hypothetical protein [Streptomyces mangrovisoli]|uniref:Uncharacterized protein n=1 Tax=Streptomyces mangrovisoli TaxID=1428628 RepID=A0A1J4NPI6_9ACTN|nr:hypothetical protein [Streptomyces mangrovisoli]OIJ64216.1 hypothetical protein WN71_030150 [Streptomyces mangrovisoli]